MNKLICFGFGYSARFLVDKLDLDSWDVIGTYRTKKSEASNPRIELIQFDGSEYDKKLHDHIKNATHILISAPPDEAGDPVLNVFLETLKEHKDHIQWIGYLSTVGVYGNWDGEWVDENSELRAENLRGIRRIKAEKDWLSLAEQSGLPVHVFRLAGIYGPGRNQLERILKGKARRLIKQGQVFNRIHVEDIAEVLRASIDHPKTAEIYNVCDDLPCPPQEPIEYAASMMKLELPEAEAFETAELSEMARSFYSQNRRISNAKIRKELGVNLNYPTYREGLESLYQSLKTSESEAN